MIRKLREYYAPISNEWWLCAASGLSVTGSYGTNPHFYPRSYSLQVLVCFTCVCMSSKHVLQVHQPGLDAESGDCSCKDPSYILKVELKLRFLCRRSDLNLGWCELLFLTAGCFHWFVEKSKLAWTTLIILTEHTSGQLLAKPLLAQLLLAKRLRSSAAAFNAVIHCCCRLKGADGE